MNWNATSSMRQRHRRITIEATEAYYARHGVRDMTAAQREWCKEHGEPDGCLRLRRNGGVLTPRDVQRAAFTCRHCGTAMETITDPEVVPSCPAANPRRYTALIYCDSCGWHWYARDPLTDVFRASRGKLKAEPGDPFRGLRAVEGGT